MRECTLVIKSVLTPCALHVQGQTLDECIKRDVFTRNTLDKKVSQLELTVSLLVNAVLSYQRHDISKSNYANLTYAIAKQLRNQNLSILRIQILQP